MSEVDLEQLLDSLLYEGYALYPYTPGAMKNSTPTPFGIVYPPAYAAGMTSTFDHLELRVAVDGPPSAQLDTDIRFLLAGGARHQAAPQRLELDAATIEHLTRSPLQRETSLDTDRSIAVTFAVSLRVERLGENRHELILRVENRTPCEHGLDRGAALTRSLLSTHPILRIRGGRFVSPLDSGCASVNTFPVLASADDNAVIGATIMLPDHPQIAPESRGGLFDSTEIEEALLLHVQVLSDAEREQIERDDPVVREMVARAASVTPEEILALHGRVSLRDPPGALTERPPQEPPDIIDPQAGEAEASVDGVRFLRGGKVRIRPGDDADLHARMLDGRVATIERIMIDYDGKVHLGVTIDGDPGQELLRDSGRLLFFFAPEVEVLS
jgi:hypothetical protein